MGWEGTVYTDEYAGENPDTGRDQWNEDTTGTPCTIRVESGNRQPAQMESAGGETTSFDTFIVVDPDEVTVNDGRAQNERPSDIVDESTGVRYEVVRVRNPHNGLLVCECRSET